MDPDRWRRRVPSDESGVTEGPDVHARLAQELVDAYPSAVAEVYGFLLPRCGSPTLAEDLTAETFMAAVAAIARSAVDTITTGWLIVVARRRLVDHWRRWDREERSLSEVAQQTEHTTDPWDEVIDVDAARTALLTLAPQHRAALTLRYVDGLSVPDVAEQLERGVHATEGLLQRARVALRKAYTQGDADEA
jgi:RNA polymerase sigma-70 factor (ECF subfamily)